MSKVKQILDLVDGYELSLAKCGQMKFERVQNNSAVVKDFLYSNEDEINKIIGGKLSASEALFGFCGWLASREKQTVMSSKDFAGDVVELISEFCKANKLTDPVDDWEKNLIRPD